MFCDDLNGKQIQKREIYIYIHIVAFLVAQMVKNAGDQVRSLGQEEPLEKRNGYPTQYSCLENSMDIGVWQATVHETAKS